VGEEMVAKITKKCKEEERNLCEIDRNCGQKCWRGIIAPWSGVLLEKPAVSELLT
jgi:hypothetical protein